MPWYDENSIPVTRPLLPPLEEFIPYLESIWENAWLTNDGPFHRQFESELATYLGVEHLSLFTNGTLALITALQALDIQGEVITTPYSFVATSHALIWNNIQPVFADIDPDTLNLDPVRIEPLITERTRAILPVHVYGNPCDTKRIDNIAQKHGLKVIYDAAHAFNVRQDGHPVVKDGDLSILSFHATKVFNTFEGGAIVCRDSATKQAIDKLKNFGLEDEVTMTMPGINAKMSEFQAAFGLLQLQHVDKAIERRGRICARYRKMLSGIEGIRLHSWPDNTRQNYGYFPIFVDERFPISREALYLLLRSHGIYARRYFYPLISNFPFYQHHPSAQVEFLPVANRCAEQVLCIPVSPTLSDEQQNRVISVIRSAAGLS